MGHFSKLAEYGSSTQGFDNFIHLNLRILNAGSAISAEVKITFNAVSSITSQDAKTKFSICP